MRYLTMGSWLIFMALAACGGGGAGGGSGVDPRLARLDIYEAQRLRVLGDPGAGVMGMPATPIGTLPPSGQVAFSGAGSVFIFQPDRALALYGDATLTLDLATDGADGALTNVFGEALDGGVVDYAGTITLTGTEVGENFTLAYLGVLSEGGNSFGFDGALDGTLLGDPLGGFVAVDLAAAIDQSGVAREGTVVLFGEGVLPPTPAP